MSEEAAPVLLAGARHRGRPLGEVIAPGWRWEEDTRERWAYSFPICPLPLRWIKELRPNGRWP